MLFNINALNLYRYQKWWMRRDQLITTIVSLNPIKETLYLLMLQKLVQNSLNLSYSKPSPFN